MPAGILTCRVRVRLIRPAPWQVSQGSGTTLPLPWQVGQVCCTEKKPCWMRTTPCPPQVRQVWGLVPGLAPLPLQVPQLSQEGTRISVS